MALQDIYAELKTLDTSDGNQKAFYELTDQNLLGSNWWVCNPYGDWSSYPKLASISPQATALETAVSDAISFNKNLCQIDITNLATSTGKLFIEAMPKLVDFINGLDSDVIPVIRYLKGAPSSRSDADASNDDTISVFFNAGITNDKAMFYWGNYAPNIEISATDTQGTESYLSDIESYIETL